MAKGVSLRLYDDSTTAQANVAGITALWWDQTVVYDFGAPIGRTNTASTDENGDLILDLSDVSGLQVGDWGFLVLYKLDGDNYKDSPIFASQVQVTTVGSVTKLEYSSGWTRPVSWPALSDVSGGNKFSGLYAVFPKGPNFVALKFTCSDDSQYTVDWGDSTSNENINSATIAEHSFDYNNCSDNDAGKLDAEACVFTDSGDTIGITGHNYANGTLIAFASIVTTTGISTATLYHVVNAATDTFQVSDTIGGTAKTLTSDGTGTIYRVKNRFAVVDIIPTTGGKDIIGANLQIIHSSLLAFPVTANWVDIDIHASMCGTLYIANDVNVKLPLLNQFKAASLGTVTDFSNLFYECFALSSLLALDTASAESFHNCFYGTAIKTLPLIDTSACSDFSLMFNWSPTLQSIPKLNTSSGTDFSYMFPGCQAIVTVPLLDTSFGIYFSHMFEYCPALSYVPFFDTTNGTDFSSMFSYDCGLQTVSTISVANGEDFSNMFYKCYGLQSARLEGTAQNITYPAAQLSGTELDSIYTGLAEVVGKTITVTGNYGTASDTPSIATNKGWTVVS